ncbi:MAG: DUF4469 domain-containing protein [Treponema sp.]|jgi:hypothetical protein|nr:DUF4469 domain-containing protein [Treponema sp.]
MDVDELVKVFHRIRVKLYLNYIPGIKGKYIARTVSEKTLSVKEVCDAMFLRGGFRGDPAEVEQYIALFNREVAYQLCDGFAVSTGYYSVHPSVGGTFDSKQEGVSPDKHPITFSFRVLEPLHKLVDDIEVFVEGVAESGAFINEFLDVTTDLINQKATVGGQFILTGNKIKIAGDAQDVGLYFTTPSAPDAPIKVGKLALNDPNRLVGIIPELLPDKPWTLEVHTQYTNGSTTLKEVRTIVSDFTVTV